MAKQKGLHKLAGKVDEQSYYYSKNGGYQSRKINPGIGERVKNDPAYSNTRLNNAEFGAAGACAGAMIREVSKRWRYILNSIATGLMVKEIKSLMELDTTSPWGQRTVKQTDMPTIQEKYNQFSKNQMPELIVAFVENHCTYNASTHKVVFGDADVTDLELNEDFVNYLESIGARGVQVSIYSFATIAPQFDSMSRRYLPTASSLEFLISGNASDPEGGDVLISGTSVDCQVSPINSATAISGLLVICEPLKIVGNDSYVLQQHCSAYWKSIQAAV